MDKRIAVRAAGVGLGVAALAAGAADPALASAQAHAGLTAPVSTAVFAAHPDHDAALEVQERIDALVTWANALAAKFAALPDTTVVTGLERQHLEFKLAMVTRVIAAIDRATSTSSPLTAAQKAQLTSVAATLATVKAKLAAILANSPAPAAVTTKTRTFTFTPFATDPTRHHCDGTFGGRDGSWTWGGRDGSWTWGSGDHHWWH